MRFCSGNYSWFWVSHPLLQWGYSPCSGRQDRDGLDGCSPYSHLFLIHFTAPGRVRRLYCELEPLFSLSDQTQVFDTLSDSLRIPLEGRKRLNLPGRLQCPVVTSLCGNALHSVYFWWFLLDYDGIWWFLFMLYYSFLRYQEIFPSLNNSVMLWPGDLVCGHWGHGRISWSVPANCSLIFLVLLPLFPVRKESLLCARFIMHSLCLILEKTTAPCDLGDLSR